MSRKKHPKKFKRNQCFLIKIFKLRNARFLPSFKRMLRCLCFKIIIGKVTNLILEGFTNRQLKGVPKIKKERFGNSIEFMKDFGQIRIFMIILKTFKLSCTITL